MKSAVILSTGDELTTGRVVDTNSAYIADKLSSQGLEVSAIVKVGDDSEKLLWALRHATGLADLVIGTGGLGPTTDDLTTETVAEFLGREVDLHEDVAAEMRQRFLSRGHPWTLNNLKQARFPKGSTLIRNPRGSAPGFRIMTEERKWLVWLPGVPREMVGMMEAAVLPWIEREKRVEGEIRACTFKIHGLTESKLDDILKRIALPENARLSFRVYYPDLSLRLVLKGGSEDAEKFATLKTDIEALLRPYIYGEGDQTLEEVVGGLLRGRGLTLALAESCTGGYLSHRITSVPGSSDYLRTGVVAYTNDAKIGLLGVKNSTLERHGAVSGETALEMADGIRRRSGASIGLSTTGVAGPSGGSPEIPVGTVWIGMARVHTGEARRLDIGGERERVIHGASQAALHWLRTALLEEDCR